MATPPVTALDSAIDRCLTDFNAVQNEARALTIDEAAAITEWQGLYSDPVLGPGNPSLSALNLDWNHFFRCHFETTQMGLILFFQQSLDRKRAEGHVFRLRTRVAVQDPAVFNLNQIA
jgi:hypothetical protein